MSRDSIHRAICKEYNSGYCKDGDENCKFLHYLKTEKCKYYMSPNGCKYSDSYCKYIHSNDGYSSEIDNSASCSKGLTLSEKLLIFAEMKDLFDIESPVTDLYINQMKKVICRNFPMMDRLDMNSLMRQCDFNYIKTYACMISGLQSLGLQLNGNGNIANFRINDLEFDSMAVTIPSTENDKSDNVVFINVINKKYSFSLSQDTMEPRLKKEIDFIKRMVNRADNLFYTTQCDICCSDHPASEMISCTASHEVCRECLSNYLNNSIFALGKMELKCMMECDAIYSRRQVEKAVSSDVMRNYDKRVIEENLSQAGIENMIQCPDCGFFAQLDDASLIFNCLNCLKLMCRHCLKTIIDEEWDKHLQAECIGKELDEVKNNRIKFEERMTALKIRKCPNCGAGIVKDDGCNHIICKCGTHLCYICKQQFTNVYLHFSQSSCSAHTSPEEDEEKAILELKSSANRKRKRLLGVEDDKIIGVPTWQEKEFLSVKAESGTHPHLILPAPTLAYPF